MSVRSEDTPSRERSRATGPQLYCVSGDGSVTAIRTPTSAGLFSFIVEQINATHVVIRLAGEIDMLTAPDFRAGVLDGLAARPQQLMLDFSAVTFFGCSGLAVLVEVKRRAENQGTNLCLAGMERAAVRLLHVTELAALFGDPPPPPDRAAG